MSNRFPIGSLTSPSDRYNNVKEFIFPSDLGIYDFVPVASLTVFFYSYLLQVEDDIEESSNASEVTSYFLFCISFNTS